MADEIQKVEIVSPATTATPSEEEKSVLQAQADQMYGKAQSHAPAKPTRLDYELNGGIPSTGAPVAQGPNTSKEEAEYAANLAASGGKVESEKKPASTEAKSKK